MKKLIVKPCDWMCELKECPGGLFAYNDALCFRSEYSPDDVFVCDSGEIFWGGVSDKNERSKLIVQPCEYFWEED